MSEPMNNKLPELMELLQVIENNDVVNNLRFLAERFPNQVCISNGFGLEGQVLTHLIFSNDIPIKVFTIDTGRMFMETYAVWSSTINRYDKKIISYSADREAVENLMTNDGPNGFYCDVAARKRCCYTRKVVPLQRALAGQKIWISGIRAEQSEERSEMSLFSWDASRSLYKYNPLFHWSETEIKEFIRAYNIPYNSLYDRGFQSIGCAPCTRAVLPGQDQRSGRWWWEDSSTKECGIHLPAKPTEPQTFTI
jgi:phosphoadenosine phosphosulfate reductase